MIEHFRLARDLGEIAGKGRLVRGDRDLGQNLAALRLDRLGEIIAVIVAKGEIGKDHRYFLAQIFRHKGRHCQNLTFDIGDARLKRVAVKHPAGDVMAFGDNEIGQF